MVTNKPKKTKIDYYEIFISIALAVILLLFAITNSQYAIWLFTSGG